MFGLIKPMKEEIYDKPLDEMFVARFVLQRVPPLCIYTFTLHHYMCTTSTFYTSVHTVSFNIIISCMKCLINSFRISFYFYYLKACEKSSVGICRGMSYRFFFSVVWAY